MNNINNYSRCKNILCNTKPPIINRKTYKKWLLKNHPDKVVNNKVAATKKYIIVDDCVRKYLPDNNSKINCDEDNNNLNTEHIIKPKIDKKKASCLRKIENWAFIQNYHNPYLSWVTFGVGVGLTLLAGKLFGSVRVPVPSLLINRPG